MTASRRFGSSSTRASNDGCAESMRSSAMPHRHRRGRALDRVVDPRVGERRRSSPSAPVVAPRYAEAMARVRVALCQLNTVVGDLDGNVARIARRARARPRPPAADIAVFPELADHRLPARGPAAQAGVRAPTTARRSTRSRPRTGRCAAVVGFVDAGPRPATTPPRSAPTGEVRGTLPQAASCRTTRCSTSSATSRRAPSRCSST